MYIPDVIYVHVHMYNTCTLYIHSNHVDIYTCVQSMYIAEVSSSHHDPCTPVLGNVLVIYSECLSTHRNIDTHTCTMRMKRKSSVSPSLTPEWSVVREMATESLLAVSTLGGSGRAGTPTYMWEVDGRMDTD